MAKITLYIPDSEPALAELQAFRDLAARRGLSLAQLVRTLMRGELSADGAKPRAVTVTVELPKRLLR